MSNPSLYGSEVRGIRSRRSILTIAFFFVPLTAPQAQVHDGDRDHDHLHFSHPLVTESPSPDTKIRLDYIYSTTSGITGIREDAIRLEGEYGFTDGLSLALVAPFISVKSPTVDRTSGLGNIELSLKAASLVFAERGLLLGGGLSAALPTGSDQKGIGSSHIVEVEPFVDVGYKRGAFELVGFSRLSSTFHRRAGEEAERNLAFDFSALYQILSRLEGLLEVTTARALIGPESGTQQTFVAPGLKVYPFTNRQLMFGASMEIGTGIVHDTRALLVSGFYHF